MSITADSILTLSAEDVVRHLSFRQAVYALGDTLTAGLQPADSHPRASVPLTRGSFLLMPDEYGPYAGVKVLTVAPGNPARNLPKIQGAYLLFDADTMAQLAHIDGVSLTSIRTPAVSALGVDHLAASGASVLVVFGTGPQALHHVRAVGAVRDLTRVSVVGRRADKTAALVAQLRAEGYDAGAGTTADVADAQIVLCCTSSREPLFDGSAVRDDAVVVAMGSHEPDARETDDALVRRSTVYVEDVDTALREAGDIVMARRSGAVTRDRLIDLPTLVSEGAAERSGPAFFKTVGMGWQDLITAGAVYDAVRASKSA